MGLFNVPQFIDIEDKIVGPFTAKQLGWMGSGAVVLLIFWFFLDFTAFIFVAVIIGGIFGMMAFYKPNGQPMITFILNLIAFTFRPKIYVWRRTPDTQKGFEPKAKKDAIIPISTEKKVSEKKIREISEILDKRF